MTRPAGARDGGAAPDCRRLSIYMVCLGLSLALLLAGGGGGGLVFWALAGSSALGIAVGALAPAGGREPGASGIAAGRPPQAATAVAAALALAEAATGGAPVWPAVLVLLFAGRVLAEIADLRLRLAWQAPLRRHPPAAAQSVGAALAFGGFLTLMFEQLLALGAPAARAAFGAGAGEEAAGVAIDALLGDTPVHRALVYLFFVVVALVADAWRLHWRDRAALAALRRLLGERQDRGAAALRAALGELAPVYPGNGALLTCRATAAADGAGEAALEAAVRAATAFRQASRRFARSLVPLLPLLGFVGTVIGLSITLGELPRSAGGGRAAADITASLGGLAIKFQTTLLGLVGGMVASTALNALEKAETELAAECALVVAAAAGPPACSAQNQNAVRARSFCSGLKRRSPLLEVPRKGSLSPRCSPNRHRRFAPSPHPIRWPRSVRWIPQRRPRTGTATAPEDYP